MYILVFQVYCRHIPLLLLIPDVTRGVQQLNHSSASCLPYIPLLPTVPSRLTIVNNNQHHEHIRRKCPYIVPVPYHVMPCPYSDLQLPGFLQSHGPGQRDPEVNPTQC